MKRLILSTAFTASMPSGSAADAACGDIPNAAFSWPSSKAPSHVDQIIPSAGYVCPASIVAGATMPTITAMIDKGQPDRASDATQSLLGEVYSKGAGAGRVSDFGVAISDGTVSGWHIPTYAAEAHPGIKTVGDAIVPYRAPTTIRTRASKHFADAMDLPVKDDLGKRFWTQAEVNQVAARMTDNQANGEDGDKWVLQNMPEVWTTWVAADAAEQIKALLSA